MTQEEALAILKTGVNVFLTGEPGSGKTHTVNAYVQYLRERGVEPAITASTGIAATHIGGYTIHSWSGVGVRRDISDYDIEMLLSKEKTAKRIIDAKVLIIDEISMLDATILGSVDRVLRALRRRPLMEEEPFGGLQVVFVGDFFQLPPVPERGEKSRFAFGSQSWREANPVVCYLSEQHRQEDPVLLDLLLSMRRGELDSEHFDSLSSRIGVDPASDVVTRLYTHNADVDRLNQDQLATLDGAEHRYEMQSQGGRALVESLKNHCLSPQTLVLKEGAKVMFTRNNFDAGYVNGTLGTVTGFDDGGLPIVETRSGRTLLVDTIDWTIQDGNKILAKITQLPLRLAWAITVHKSQGMSLDAAVIDLGAAFEYGQGYVALSRVRSLKGLYLERMSERALMLHPAVVEKDLEFHKRSQLARTKFAALAPEQRQTMEQNFLKAIGGKEPSLVEKALEVVEKTVGKLAKLREKYPNAGRAWTPQDDDILKEMFARDVPQKEIAVHFGRKPSAIHARLGHFGLVEDFWANRKRKTSTAERSETK
ncbi:AAA family ATPase [Candidatus Parcubacteria bacterium]|nr:MAG: AAA family ATPase [Candidatus Parcubacteria bacterium]